MNVGNDLSASLIRVGILKQGTKVNMCYIIVGAPPVLTTLLVSFSVAAQCPS